MNIDIKAVHFDVADETREFITAKTQRLDYAKDLLVDFLFTLTKEKSDYTAETKLNFRWGVSAHLKVQAFDLHEAIDKLVDKVDLKVKKEKEKVQKHKGNTPVSRFGDDGI